MNQQSNQDKSNNKFHSNVYPNRWFLISRLNKLVNRYTFLQYWYLFAIIIIIQTSAVSCRVVHRSSWKDCQNGFRRCSYGIRRSSHGIRRFSFDNHPSNFKRRPSIDLHTTSIHRWLSQKPVTTAAAKKIKWLLLLMLI